jgi:hypothetical protein
MNLKLLCFALVGLSLAVVSEVFGRLSLLSGTLAERIARKYEEPL